MKKAFTMLELIMVIVIIGILAAVIIPRTASNDTAEAAVKLISDIRYTQHLAMVDDKYGQNASWYRDLWQIRFNGNSYSIISDNGTRPAMDPINKDQNMTYNLNKQFGIIGIDVGILGEDCGDDDVISFDHMGRPMFGSLATITTAYSNLMNTNCTITISGSATDVAITIRPETGYASLP